MFRIVLGAVSFRRLMNGQALTIIAFLLSEIAVMPYTAPEWSTVSDSGAIVRFALKG